MLIDQWGVWKVVCWAVQMEIGEAVKSDIVREPSWVETMGLKTEFSLVTDTGRLSDGWDRGCWLGCFFGCVLG